MRVNLAAIVPVISGNDFKPFPAEKFGRQFFTFGAGFDFIAHNYVIPLNRIYDYVRYEKIH